MKKILIATPIYPPSSGGPATHSKKLEIYFGARAKLFIFEKLNFLPFGVRHFVAFMIIFFKSIFQVKIIFALDGFSVAMPAILVGKILRIPVVLRIGGDLVHEQYVAAGNMVPMNIFYEKYEKGELQLPGSLKIKMFLQKLVIENSSGIIFNTEWQRNMYEKNYSLPKTWVLYNPVEKMEKGYPDKGARNFGEDTSQNFVLTSIVRQVPFKNLKLIQSVIDEINNENLLPKKFFLETKNGPHTETMERIKNSDAYITGAISDIAPNQLLEALTLGVPSICTINTGYYDLLKNNPGIIFVDTQNALDLKNALLKIFNESENKKMREALKNFSWDYTWEKYFTEYEKIVEFFNK